MPPRSHDSIWQSLGKSGFWLVVGLTHLFAITLSLVFVPGLHGPPVHWLALTLLYWACYRPEWQPVVMVFLVGLLGDLLMGSPLVGLTAFCGIILSVLLARQEALLLALPFWGLWGVVTVLLFLWRGTEALVLGLALGQWPPFMQWGLSALLSALVFPVLALLLSPLRRAAFRF